MPLFGLCDGNTAIGAVRQALALPGNADLLVGQITGLVFGPGVIGELMCTHARIAAANIEVVALAAASLDLPGTRLEAGHERVGGVGPDLPKRPLVHIPAAARPL